MRVMPWNLWWRFGDEWRDRERRRALPPAHRQRGGAPAPSRDRDEIVALAVVVDHPDGPLHAVASCIDWKLEFAPQRLAQTRALAALLTDPARDGPLPVFLTADLNAPPSAVEIQVLSEVRSTPGSRAEAMPTPGIR
jgi:endonuclease/exonuclease/phosphatase (EEP) superfamily protein YafD